MFIQIIYFPQSDLIGPAGPTLVRLASSPAKYRPQAVTEEISKDTQTVSETGNADTGLPSTWRNLSRFITANFSHDK